MRLSLFGLVLSVAGVVVAAEDSARGQVRQFPYEAVVESDDVYLRSGQGARFYPTGKLRRGQRVTVHRHDPGGWFMIAPPDGSFSWVRAEHVRSADGNRGEAVAAGAVVWVGSMIDDTHEVTQVELSPGDRVQILEEKTLKTADGPRRMFKIRPPAGEFRWVPGKYLVPMDPTVRQQQDRDPWAVPSQAQRPPASEGPPGNPFANLKPQPEPGPDFPEDEDDPGSGPAVRSPLDDPVIDDEAFVVRSSPVRTADQTAAAPSATADDWVRLQELDEHLRSMAQQEPADWDFDALDADYRRLRQQTTHAGLIAQIALRLAEIERHQEIKAEYDDFIRLTSETDQRDAELQARQHEVLSGPAPLAVPTPADAEPVPVRPREPQPTPVRADDSSATDEFLPPIEQPADPTPLASPARPAATAPAGSIPTVTPQIAVPGAIPAGPVPHGTAAPGTGPMPQPGSATVPASRFDGAGIVQRVPGNRFRGGPQHVLVTPDGRLLAWLQAERNVNLDQFVGQPMGIHGRRWFRPEFQADFIHVHALSPVRLGP